MFFWRSRARSANCQGCLPSKLPMHENQSGTESQQRQTIPLCHLWAQTLHSSLHSTCFSMCHLPIIQNPAPPSTVAEDMMSVNTMQVNPLTHVQSSLECHRSIGMHSGNRTRSMAMSFQFERACRLDANLIPNIVMHHNVRSWRFVIVGCHQ